MIHLILSFEVLLDQSDLLLVTVYLVMLKLHLIELLSDMLFLMPLPLILLYEFLFYQLEILEIEELLVLCQKHVLGHMRCLLHRV